MVFQNRKHKFISRSDWWLNLAEFKSKGKKPVMDKLTETTGWRIQGEKTTKVSYSVTWSGATGGKRAPLGKDRADLQWADEHWPNLTHFSLIYGLWSLSRHSFVLGGHKSPAPRSRSADPPLQSWQPPSFHSPVCRLQLTLSTQSRNHSSHKRRQLITASRQ